MTIFEKDYLEAQEGDAIEVLKRRKKEIQDLYSKLGLTKNKFRAQCIMQEIERKRIEYNKIDELF